MNRLRLAVAIALAALILLPAYSGQTGHMLSGAIAYQIPPPPSPPPPTTACNYFVDPNGLDSNIGAAIQDNSKSRKCQQA